MSATELSTVELRDTSSNMDPRLQRLVDRRARGMRLAATASTVPNEVAVIAIVKDAQSWVDHADVRPGMIIGESESGIVVTGRVPVQRLESLRSHPTVISMKAAQPLHATLRDGVREINALPPSLPLSGGPGSGVVVGIVDYGCDFAHENFRTSNGASRVEAIWDQAAPVDPSGDVDYGKIYKKNRIDMALHMPDPYTALGYGPPPDSMFEVGTHGTHVMDIAAGNGRGSGVAGVAPEADVIFVEIAAGDVPWSGETVVSSNFGDSVQLLEALRWIFTQAGDRPCVINVSLGTNGGPHDGSSPFERGIDAMLRERPNRAVVIAASNSYSDHIHAAAAVDAGHSVDLSWHVPEADLTQSEVEIWYDAPGEIDIELLDPAGRSLGRVAPGKVGRIYDSSGKTAIFIASRTDDPNNHSNTIGVFLERGVPSGTWILRLHNTGGTRQDVHAWIERNDAGQSSFTGQHVDDRYTLGSISCGHETLVVGSYDAHKASAPLSYFSSSGPTRDNRTKPEISAPGHQVLAAHSRTKSHVTRKSGTSMAAPMVTGAVAVLMSEARRRNIDLPSQQIRNIVTSTARTMGAGWHERYGYGKIDVHAMVAALPASSPLTGSTLMAAGGGPALTSSGQVVGSAAGTSPPKNG